MTRILLKLFWISLFFGLSMQSLAAQSGLTYERERPPTMEELMSQHERFVYNVRYGFFNLGEVEVELLPDTTYEGKTVHHMRTIMRSSTRIPFISDRDIHYQNFFSYNDTTMFSHYFWRDDLHDDEEKYVEIFFDREQEKVFFFEDGEPGDTLDLVEPASGGDIIFYFSRLFAGTNEAYELPAYIENEKGMVTVTNSPETEKRSYDAFPEDIETYRSEGTADIDGPFGFRGRFTSWFATDDLRIPVEAHVRIYLGNVKIRLISYEQLGKRTEREIPAAEPR